MVSYICIVEDEKDIADLISLHLSKAGYKTAWYEDGQKFLKSIAKKKPDLIVLDLMLPDIDGFDICKELKKKDQYAHIPVIMLTARGEVTDKIVGLELGADDYMTKPFSPKELVARVKAVLRRHIAKATDTYITIGTLLRIYPDKFKVEIDGKAVDLTTTEFKILELLASKPGHVYSREQLLDHLWGQDKIVIDRTIDVHIRHLREKLGKAAHYIKNVRGVGYKLAE